MTSQPGPPPRRTVRETALRLTIISGERDEVGHRPRYTEIVHRAHAAGLAGASVLRGIEGFGVSGQVHTNRLLSLSEDLPVVVMIVDDVDRIEAFLPELDGLVTEGMVVVDDVRVVRHVTRESAG
jgi:PII-like signaling protein